MTEKEKTPGSENQQVVNPNPSDTKTYSKADVDKLVEKAIREATGKMGQKHKLELDNITSQLTEARTEKIKLQGMVDDQKTEIETITVTLDELAKEDPDKKNIARLTRDLTATKKSIQGDKRQVLVEREQVKAERQDIDKIRRENLIATVAKDFKDGNAETLAGICDTFGVGADEEKIRAAAGTKWEPIGTEPEVPNVPVVPVDSGFTDGGASLSDDEYITAYSEGKVHDHTKAQKILERI